LAKRALRWEHIRYVHHFVVMSLLATAVYYLAFAKGTALLPSSIAGLGSGARFSRRGAHCSSLVRLGRDRHFRRRLHDSRLDERRVFLRLRSKIHQPAEAPCSRFDNISDRARHDLPFLGDKSGWNWSRL